MSGSETERIESHKYVGDIGLTVLSADGTDAYFEVLILTIKYRKWVRNVCIASFKLEGNSNYKFPVENVLISRNTCV